MEGNGTERHEGKVDQSGAERDSVERAAEGVDGPGPRVATRRRDVSECHVASAPLCFARPRTLLPPVLSLTLMRSFQFIRPTRLTTARS